MFFFLNFITFTEIIRNVEIVNNNNITTTTTTTTTNNNNNNNINGINRIAYWTIYIFVSLLPCVYYII